MNISTKEFPIDAVYTWVDGRDPVWQEKRKKRAEELGLPLKGEAVDPARFRDNEELRFSLRSLAKYAPWINRVHVITAGQTPSWANKSELDIVFHEKVFPSQDLLPVFSSRPIEMCVHRVPGLAENFLYFNDDFMLGRRLAPGDFFKKNGQPRVWAVKHSSKRLKRERASKNPSSYRSAVLKACDAIKNKFDQEFPYRTRHFPKAMTVSTTTAMWETFPHEVNLTLNSPFRSHEDVSTIMLYPLYLLATGQGSIRIINSFAHIKDFLWGGLGHIGLSLGDSNMDAKLRRIKLMKPKTFCINDAPKADKESREKFQNFMLDLFPDPSPYEIK